MTVDTGEFRALTEQVGAVGRKVSTLTGRVTVMGNHVNRLDGLVEDDIWALVRALGWLTSAPEPSAPRPGRHLRIIKGDGQ